MLKNYLKIAFRNIYRNKIYSLINILGLTLGITCCSLLFLFVIDENSYDMMYQKSERIARIVEIDKSEGETRYYGMTSPRVGPALVEDYEEVENATRLFQFGGQIVFEKDGDKFSERNYFFADKNFFDVFDLEWIAGDPETAFDEPYSIILDEDWATRLFGQDDPLGEEIVFNGELNYIVKGVIKKLPQNSHLQFSILASTPQIDWVQEYLKDWNTYGAYTYVVLDKNADAKAFESKIPGFIKKYFKSEDHRNFYLQPLSEIHFNSKNIEYGTESVKGQKAYIYIFIAVGVFMLLIACINYMNLATAKSLHRGKEIGIRKVSGALRHQLVFQFLSESTLMALVSLLLSIGLVDLLLPSFNVLTGKQFTFDTETFTGIFFILFLITLVVGLVSGIYPAVLMSRLKSANILKGDMNKGRGSVMLRQVLVITQFTLSIIMIIATIVVYNQMHYIQHKSLGFDKSQLMVIDINNGNVRERAETMAQEFLKSPYITEVGISSRVPGEWKGLEEIYVRTAGSFDSLRSNFIGFDQNMLEVYKMELLEGDNFTGNAKVDSLHIMLNESAVKSLNLADPVGQYISYNGGQLQIIGVIKDFNFQSLHNAITPLIIGYRNNPFQTIDYFSLKFDANHVQQAVDHATMVHNSFDENTPIEYHFLDDQWDLFYKNDKRAGNVFAIGAGITIFIACLGLFGLASFIVQRRTKEIGVRKVLGATIFDLFILLSKTFAIQIIIAFLIAAPIAWFFMQNWLNNFAFHFKMGFVEFVLAGLAALFIALISISYRVIKVTLLSPAHTLKDE